MNTILNGKGCETATSVDIVQVKGEIHMASRGPIGVLGLGYVGLPLVSGFVGAGHRVVGFDVSKRVVDSLLNSKSHVDDLSDDELRELLQNGFSPTVRIEDLAPCTAYIICVPTPLSPHGGPDLSAVEQAGEAVSGVLSPGDLVVLESTTYPGTTQRVLLPLLEQSGLRGGVDFSLAFSPERIDPGNVQFGFTNTPKIVGGLTEQCRESAMELYGSVIEEVVPAKGLAEAEMAKLIENTYRVVNIALVNEMAKFSHDLGIDIWDAIDCAATKPFGFQAFYPGPGVGGHCIPIDPNYLSFHVRTEMGYGFRFVELAQEINHSMPGYVARRVSELLNRQDLSVRGARILLIGITYKADVGDLRETPAAGVAMELLRLGAHVEFLDPFVDSWEVPGEVIPKRQSMSAEDVDCAIVLQHHSSLNLDQCVSGARAVIDTRGKLAGYSVERL